MSTSITIDLSKKTTNDPETYDCRVSSEQMCGGSYNLMRVNIEKRSDPFPLDIKCELESVCCLYYLSAVCLLSVLSVSCRWVFLFNVVCLPIRASMILTLNSSDPIELKLSTTQDNIVLSPNEDFNVNCSHVKGNQPSSVSLITEFTISNRLNIISNNSDKKLSISVIDIHVPTR